MRLCRVSAALHLTRINSFHIKRGGRGARAAGAVRHPARLRSGRMVAKWAFGSLEEEQSKRELRFLLNIAMRERKK